MKKTVIKTYKSHSVASIFMGLLSLIFVGTFAFFLFMPAFRLLEDSNTITYNGLDYVLLGIGKYIKPIIPNLPYENGEKFLAYLNDYAGDNGLVKMFLGFHSTAELILSGLIVIALILAIIEIILALVWFIKGRITFPKATNILARWSSGLFDVSGLLLYVYILLFNTVTKDLSPIVKGEALAYPGIVVGVQTVIIIIMGFIYRIAYKNRVYDDPKKYEQLHPQEMNLSPQYEQGLPLNITSIGDKAFMNDQSLTQAKIPHGISMLGNNAFANCSNLKIVYIPRSVLKIGNNCFYNTKNLQVIAYEGTQEEWSLIKRGSNWLVGSATTNINTKNGLISVNPNH